MHFFAFNLENFTPDTGTARGARDKYEVLCLILFAFHLHIAKILWPRGGRRVLSASHLLCFRIIRTLSPHIADSHISIKHLHFEGFTFAWFCGSGGC